MSQDRFRQTAPDPRWRLYTLAVALAYIAAVEDDANLDPVQEVVFEAARRRFNFVPDVVRVLAVRPLVARAQSELRDQLLSDELSIGFNGRYLLDFCTAIEPEQQTVMELVDETAPALLRVESDLHYRYVVMPMRLF